MTVKEQAIQLIQSMPDDSTLEDIAYRLYLQQMVARGMADVEAGRVVPHEEAKRRMGQVGSM